MITTVAFDVMDTLLHDPYREALAAATGGRVQQLLTRRDPELYPSLERDEITEEEYWRRHLTSGIWVDPERFHEVRSSQTRWIEGIPQLLDALEGVVERVTASNYPRWIEELADRFLSERMEQVIASCHLGVRKPDERFYIALLERLDRAPHEVAFVDDRQVNVAAARAVGMPAFHFRDVEGLRVWLEELGVGVTVH